MVEREGTRERRERENKQGRKKEKLQSLMAPFYLRLQKG